MINIYKIFIFGLFYKKRNIIYFIVMFLNIYSVFNVISGIKKFQKNT